MILQSCDGDDDAAATADFASIASTSEEGATITIPLRNGSITESDIEFGGTAVEGVDFTLGSITAEGVQITITDDSQYEEKETIRVQIKSSGNSIHTVSIPCDGSDGGGWALADFAGEWDAVEDYGASTYGPYEIELVQDDSNPNRFDFDNFYDSGLDAYMIFDLASGTVFFPNQTPSTALTASSGTFNLCEGTLTINLNYDGGNWVYRFTKH